MDKLTAIEQALKNNPKVNVVHTKVVDFVPEAEVQFHQTVIFYIAPAKGNLKTIKQLNKFLASIVVPRLKPNAVYQFRNEGINQILYGCIEYEEVIGRIIRDQKVFLNKPIAIPYKFVDGDGRAEEITNIDLTRGIFIHPYPNSLIAQAVASGELPDGMIPMPYLQFICRRRKI